MKQTDLCYCKTLKLQEVVKSDTTVNEWATKGTGKKLQSLFFRCIACQHDKVHAFCNAFPWGLGDEASTFALRNLRRFFVCLNCRIVCVEPAADVLLTLEQVALIPPTTVEDHTTAVNAATYTSEWTQKFTIPPQLPLDESNTFLQLRCVNLTYPHRGRRHEWPRAFEISLGSSKPLQKLPPRIAVRQPQNGYRSTATEGTTRTPQTASYESATAQKRRGQSQPRPKSASDKTTAAPRRVACGASDKSVDSAAVDPVHAASTTSTPRVVQSKSQMSASTRSHISAVYDPSTPYTFPKEPWTVDKESLKLARRRHLPNVLQMRSRGTVGIAYACQLVVVQKIDDPVEFLKRKILAREGFSFDEGMMHAIRWHQSTAGPRKRRNEVINLDSCQTKGGEESDDSEVMIVSAPSSRKSILETGDHSDDDTEKSGSETEKEDFMEEVEDARVSLMCSDSAIRISCAARSQYCKHVHCFDLEFYLRHNVRFGAVGKNAWHCNRCGVPAFPHDVVVDGFVQHFIDSTDDTSAEIGFNMSKQSAECGWSVTKHLET